jgi:hypothetical protein
LGGWFVDACNGVWIFSTFIGVNDMNKQNLQIAAQAGLQQRIDNPNEIWGYREDLQRFAELVRQNAMEEAAKICDELNYNGMNSLHCAQAIRNRAEEINE